MSIREHYWPLMHWRNWLVESLPDSAIDSEVKLRLQQLRYCDVSDYNDLLNCFSTPTHDPAHMNGPLDFFFWGGDRDFARTNIRARRYMNKWYGKWQEVFKVVVGESN